MDRYPPRSSSYGYGRYDGPPFPTRGPPPPPYGYQPMQPPQMPYRGPPPHRDDFLPPPPMPMSQPPPPPPIRNNDLPIENVPKLVLNQIHVNPPVEVTPAPTETLQSYWD